MYDSDEYAYGALDQWAEEMSTRFFLTAPGEEAFAQEAYDWGRLQPDEWLPLIRQLTDLVDMDELIEASDALMDVLGRDALPVEILEDPLDYLSDLVDHYLQAGEILGDLSGVAPKGGRRQARRLAEVVAAVVDLAYEMSEAAQEAICAWANVHRHFLGKPDMDSACVNCSMAPFCGAFAPPDQPAVVTGMSLLIGLSLLRWPERAEGLPVVPVEADPALYMELLERWQSLPDEAADGPEALFAQGRLAYLLSQAGTMEMLGVLEDEEMPEASTLYARLSRAMLWVHDRCRHCEEREGVVCRAARVWDDQPSPLLDVVGQFLATGRMDGCANGE